VLDGEGDHPHRRGGSPGGSGILIAVGEPQTTGVLTPAPDNEPVIGAGSVQGLVWAVGHYRGGVLLAPVTAALVCDLLVSGTRPPERFSAARFAGVRA